MIGAGTVINPLVRIVTTIAILAAISLFVLKPILSSSEKLAGDAQQRSQRAQRQAEQNVEAIQLKVQRTVALSSASTARLTGDKRRARRIVECVRAAKTSERMQLCATK